MKFEYNEKRDLLIQIRQALARGYCTERNEKKVLDPDLLEDMAEEVIKIFSQKIFVRYI